MQIEEGMETEFAVMAKQTIIALNNASIVAKMSHWNVRGPNYYESHLMFDRIHEDLYGLMDPLIEQLRAYGFNPDFNLFQGPGIAMQSGDAKFLVGLTLDYVMSLNATLKYFFNHCTENTDDPRNVGLADHLGGMASAILVDQYLLQAWLGQ